MFDLGFVFFVLATMVGLYLLHTYEPPKEDENKEKTRRNKSHYQRTSIYQILGFSESEEDNFLVFRDHFQTFEEVSSAMHLAGLKTTRLIIGIDFTASNEWQGRRTFSRRSLHKLHPVRQCQVYNPYQRVISILGKTLQPFTEEGTIYSYGFGDARTQDFSVFPLGEDIPSRDFREVLMRYNDCVKNIILSGPTSYAPLIYKAISRVKETKGYHILIIIADGQMEQESPTITAIVEASKYPMSIIMVGVGDGPWDIMEDFDDSLPTRKFDNFQFVNFHQALESAKIPEAAFALQALMEVPDQYRAIQELGYLNKIT